MYAHVLYNQNCMTEIGTSKGYIGTLGLLAMDSMIVKFSKPCDLFGPDLHTKFWDKHRS